MSGLNESIAGGAFPSNAEIIYEPEHLQEDQKKLVEETIKNPVLSYLEQLTVATNPITQLPYATSVVSIKGLMDPVEGGDLIGFLGEFVLPIIGAGEGRQAATRKRYRWARDGIDANMAAYRQERAQRRAQQAAERAGPQVGGRPVEEVLQGYLTRQEFNDYATVQSVLELTQDQAIGDLTKKGDNTATA